MSHPAPLQSFLGGLAIPIPVHALALLNGNVFGISGFIHRAVKGSVEGAAGAVGLVLGGMLVAQLDGQAPPALTYSLSKIALSGFLVGLGTKVSRCEVLLSDSLLMLATSYPTDAPQGMPATFLLPSLFLISDVGIWSVAYLVSRSGACAPLSPLMGTLPDGTSSFIYAHASHA